MLVVLAIITIITGIVLTGRSNFTSTILLSNAAYDIALTIRNTENYGISGRASGSTATTGYGVHFTRTPANSFLVFADTYPTSPGSCHLPVTDPNAPDVHPGNCTYDVSGGNPLDVLQQTYTLGNGIQIGDFCVYTSTTGSWTCANSNGATLTSLDISFTRPNTVVNFASNGTYNANVTKSCLKLVSPQNTVRAVVVYQSGLITAASSATCP